MTALGSINVRRSHAYCKVCALPSFPADALLGVDGWLTARVKRMVCLAGLNDPFRKADSLLEELCGWRVCPELIRQHCHEQAKNARECRADLTALPDLFQQHQAEGQHTEAHIDAGKVNTPEGWRDIKLAVFACRRRGESNTSQDYEQRDLPTPSVRAVIAEVEEAQAFGNRCHNETERLGLSVVTTPDAGSGSDAKRLSVLGDGAEWIWNLATQQFAGATQVLDVYHGVEKLAEAAREAFGQGTAPVQGWLDRARQKLIAEGYVGVCESLAQPMQDEQAQGRMNAKAGEVLNYFCGHRDRLGYAVRLRRGQVIGSGLVEGTIKQRVNIRMKRGSARWLPEHVGPFVELLAMSDTPEWSEYWAFMAA